MIFHINNKPYKLNIAWNTIILSEAVRLVALKLEEPKLRHLFDTELLEYDSESMNYIDSVLEILSNCPLKVIKQTDSDSKVAMFHIIKYMVRMLYDMNIEEYQPIGIGQIFFKGKKYIMPSAIIIEDKPILCHKEPCKNIIEASNIMKVIAEMKSEGIEKMKYVCAIYLKESEGEIYDPEQIAIRAKVFQSLPMHYVWDVFFFMYYSTANYMNALLIPSLKNQTRLQRIKYIILGFFQLRRKAWLARLAKSKS
jgi:hypothetical protein